MTNKIDDDLLEILVGPVSKGKLLLKGDELLCFESMLAYKIEDGIPIMLPEEARKILIDENLD